MAGRVTIKTIARDLGISHMTVSRALSDHPNVQKETREAVQRRARELGYVKSAAASMMRGDTVNIVGLLLPNIVNEFYARFANEMAIACEAHSHQLIIHLTNDDIQNEAQALGRLREVQAKSVVMVPAPGESSASDSHLENMKVIQLIRHRDMPGPSGAILVDDRAAIRDAVVHLARNGHRRVAYIGADAQLSSGRERCAAYRDGLRFAGLDEDPRLIIADAPSFEMGRRSASAILDGKGATSVVCGGFEISNGALSVLMERGFRPNGPFSFVGYGDPSYYSWIDGGISAIKVPVEKLARRAAIRVVANADHAAPELEITESFPAELVDRSDGHLAP